MSSTKKSSRTKKTGSVSCAICEETVQNKEGIACIQCCAVRHKKKSCVGWSKAHLEKHPELARNFVCQPCKQSQLSSESDEDSEEEEPQNKMALQRTKHVDAASFERVLSKIENMEKKWDKRMDQFESIIQMCSAQIDDVTNLKKKVKGLEDRLRNLEKTPRQQESQFRDVIITNVPPMEGEVTTNVAHAVFESLSASVSAEDIQSASRFESEANKTKKYFLKVRLSSSEIKGKVIKAARAAKASLKDLNLSSKIKLPFKNENELPPDFQAAPIFVNESVTRETKSLLQKTLKLKKEGKLHTVWTYQNRVYVRKSKDAKPFPINGEEELSRL